MKTRHYPQPLTGADKHVKRMHDGFSHLSKTKMTSSKGLIRNWKHDIAKTSPMRLKIIRSREVSPVIQNSASQTKIMGSVSINKIRLINGSKKWLANDFKPVTATISLCDSSRLTSKNSNVTQPKQRKKIEAAKRAKNQASYYRGTKHVELSFEEELDVDQIKNQNSIIDKQKIENSKHPARRHQRKISEFEEEGKENLSSEGDEHEVTRNQRMSNQPKFQHEKFNDLNVKFSRNQQMNSDHHFKTDKVVDNRGLAYKKNASLMKQTQYRTKLDNNTKTANQHARKHAKKSAKGYGLNRSRNGGRNTNSSQESTVGFASSSILSDKLRESLTTLNSKKDICKRYTKNLKTMEKEMDQEKIKQKAEIKAQTYNENGATNSIHCDKRKVDSFMLGNIIKNNINELTTSSFAIPQAKDKMFKDQKITQKGVKRHLKNSKNISLNNKENQIWNQTSKYQQLYDEGDKDENTEVYNLNQYCSAANLNAFGSNNFRLPQNMILGKNRSREAQGFGSPTLRKIEIQKEKSKDAFDSVMAKHGLLKDLNNLGSFNAFWKQSPLRHQKSLDYWYQSINSLGGNSGQLPTHMKTCTQHNLNFISRKENSGSPGSIISQFSPRVVNQNMYAMGGTADNNGAGYSFPFQRRARSASPPNDPEINDKIAATLSPRHTRENKTSAVDELLEDQVMGLQDPLKSLNSIHSRIGSGSFKSRKPIVANTKFFVVGTSGAGWFTNRGSMVEDNKAISTDKMKVLSKAISHYLNGEYNQIMEKDGEVNGNTIIENDLITHDLRDHDISDANEHDLTDERITKKWEVDDWLCDEEKSNLDDNSIEAKHENGFDPFAQTKADDYQSQRNSYKNRRSSSSKAKPKTDSEVQAERDITNESIMQIIQNSQKADDRPASTNQKYVSLATHCDEPVEKNIIVDDADFELANCLEGEEWMFQTFNRKKREEEQNASGTPEPATGAPESDAANLDKPPQPTGNTKSEVSRVNNFENSHDKWESTAVQPAERPKRRKKNSKHRRTESKTFDETFLQTLASNIPS